MFRKNFGKAVITAIMALFISNVPHIAAAEVSQQMIPTQVAVEQLSRAEAQQKIQGHLARAEVQSELTKMGVDPSEISARLGALSDSELNDMALQMDSAIYGGSITGILIVVVLVLLIIYLAKRI